MIKAQLTDPLDPVSKALIRAEVSSAFSEILFAKAKDFFMFTSLFEGSNYTLGSGGWGTADENGIIVSVKPATNSEVEVRKTIEASGRLFSFEARSRARWTVNIAYGDASATTLLNTAIYIVHGDRDASLGYYGFYVSGADWKGVAKRTSASEVLTGSIQTYVNDVVHDLEATYDPRTGLLFRIDDTDRGRIKISDTGKLGGGQPNLINVYVKKTNAPKNIASSTNATPIVITTSSAHGFETGDIVVVDGHTINTAANNTNSNYAWAITKLSDTTFSLTGSVGNGVGGADGTCDFARLIRLSWYDFLQVLISDF